MKYSKLTVLLSVIIITIVACQGEVLNQEPGHSFSEKDIWSDIKLAKHYLNTVYKGVGNWGGVTTGQPGTRRFGASYTDEMMHRVSDNLIAQSTITPSSPAAYDKAYNMWPRRYNAIRKCNVFLENIGKVPNASKDQIKSMEAQVKFIRAKDYADLIDWYSWWEGDHNGVPLIKKPFNLNDNFKEKRASYSEVVHFIVSQMDSVAKVLPEKWPPDKWGHVTKGAAFALKSEILLYAASKRHNPGMDQSKWKAAADAAKAVIDLGVYSLVKIPKEGSLFEEGKAYNRNIFLQKNPEIILARPYDPAQLPSNWLDKFNSPNGYKGWGNNCVTQNIVNKFTMANGKKITNPTSGYDPQHPYKNREVRFYGNIVYNGRMYRGRKVETFLPGGKDSKDGIQGWNTCPTGLWTYKFMDESIDFESHSAPTPYIIFRLAEIYLNYAEAEYHLGNESIAREYVNKIRTRVHLPNIQSSGKQLLQDIRHERTIELVFEKRTRWSDVRRWEILPQTASQDYLGMSVRKDNNSNILIYKKETVLKRHFDKKIYSMPISNDEIRKTDLNQNPGY